MEFFRVDHLKRIKKEDLLGKAYKGKSEIIYIITGVENSIGLKAEEIESLASGKPKPVILPNDAYIAKEDLDKVRTRFPNTYARITSNIAKRETQKQ